jgi:DNA invertase Pin-like site-specific DNA recombinase
MAQQEREYISQRTKAALQALKQKGVTLGAPNVTFTANMRENALQKRRSNSLQNDANKRAYAVVKVMSGNYSEKARFLNENGFLTTKGKKWKPNQVKRLVNLFKS